MRGEGDLQGRLCMENLPLVDECSPAVDGDPIAGDVSRSTYSTEIHDMTIFGSLDGLAPAGRKTDEPSHRGLPFSLPTAHDVNPRGAERERIRVLCSDCHAGPTGNTTLV